MLPALDFQKPLKLAVDASDAGVRGVLLQEDESGVDHPVCYFSKTKIRDCYAGLSYYRSITWTSDTSKAERMLWLTLFQG